MEKQIDVCGVYLSPLSDKIIDKIYSKIFNSCIKLVQLFYPSAYGECIFCKKWLHKTVNGFDETIKLGEDLDYVNRCGKYGKFGILRGIKINFSMRRFDNEGRSKVAFRHILSTSYRIIFGQIRNDIFKYELDYKK